MFSSIVLCFILKLSTMFLNFIFVQYLTFQKHVELCQRFYRPFFFSCWRMFSSFGLCPPHRFPLHLCNHLRLLYKIQLRNIKFNFIPIIRNSYLSFVPYLLVKFIVQVNKNQWDKNGNQNFIQYIPKIYNSLHALKLNDEYKIRTIESNRSTKR